MEHKVVNNYNLMRLENTHYDADTGPAHESPSQRSTLVPEDAPTALVILHSVVCTQLYHHVQHSPQTYYTDVPRLFAGDSKAVALRGQSKIVDPQSFLDDKKDFSFVVYREYDCIQYHQQCESVFETLATDQQRSRMPLKIQAHLSVLTQDGPAATPASEKIQEFRGRMLDAVRALDRICGWHLESDYEYEEDWTLLSPYNEIYHCREALQAQRALIDPLSWPHVEHLFAYVMATMAGEYEEADVLFGKAQVSERHLAKLFRPGDILIVQIDGEEVATPCVSVHVREPSTVQLECRLSTFDGTFGLRSDNFDVTWPGQARTPVIDPISITDLPIYPLRFGEKEVWARLLARGSMLWSCRSSKFVSYNIPKQASDVQTTHSRYMIDMATYHKLHENDKPSHNTTSREVAGKVLADINDPPTDEFLVCLPAQVKAYWLLKKRWVTLKLRFVAEVVWEESAFEALVLDSRKKDMLKALVTTHDLEAQSLDIIEGKGNGLILLLHGPPGTGKTMTAEGIAEWTHKPLYRVTCGDIGTTPDVVESYLESVLHIGRVWGCVVLLDEADVFLEERSPMNLERNALVSIFLRVLEYYEGILILTTNRVGTFDEAFKSRIQLAIHYPSLNQEDRMSIWSSFLEPMGDEVDILGLRKKYVVLSMTPLNGRQIRNTIKTARQLALFKKEVMGYSHLQETIKIGNEFEDYIQQAMGQTHAERAVETFMRAPEPAGKDVA